MNTTNKNLQELISEFREKSGETKLFGRIADDLSKSRRNRREVNLTRISKFTKEGDFIVVPGKVLGGGEIGHKITVSALKFSESASQKLAKSGCTVISLDEMMKESVKGKKIRIIG